MATIPAQMSARATPYLQRFIGNRFVGNSVRDVMTDVVGGLADPFYSHGVNQGIAHVNNATGSQIPSYNSPPPNTVPNLLGNMLGGYLFSNRTYVMARATQTFHGPSNTSEGINDFVSNTHNSVPFDPFEFGS